MPRGPKGEKRPADVIGNAVHVMRCWKPLLTDDDHRTPHRPRSVQGLAGAGQRSGVGLPGLQRLGRRMVHIRTIDGDVRVRQHLGTLDAEAMKRVDRALATSLGLP